MPGIKSLQEHQYYAHKRNAFWQIMFQLFDTEFTENYELRKKLILDNKLALWDTLKLCYREGSLDSKIKNEDPNNISKLINEHNSLKVIIFNGKSAEKFYKKYNSINNSISYFAMPSTSPANAIKSFNKKLTEWYVVKELVKY